MFSKKDAGEPVEEENAEIQSEESEQEQEQVEKKVKNFPPCYPLVYHSFSACGKKKYLALMGLVRIIITLQYLQQLLIINLGRIHCLYSLWPISLVSLSLLYLLKFIIISEVLPSQHVS